MYDLFMTRTLVYVKLKNEDAGLVLLVFKISFIIQKKYKILVLTSDLIIFYLIYCTEHR